MPPQVSPSYDTFSTLESTAGDPFDKQAASMPPHCSPITLYNDSIPAESPPPSLPSLPSPQKTVANANAEDVLALPLPPPHHLDISLPKSSVMVQSKATTMRFLMLPSRVR
jgi:hypothetical protein